MPFEVRLSAVQRRQTARRVLANPARATPSRRSPTHASTGLILLRPVADLYSAVDTLAKTEIA